MKEIRGVELGIMISHHLFLCGFMGVGKSTVGRILSQKLNCPFVDTDHLIEELASKPIHRIFKEEGETGFREYESRILEGLDHRTPSVVALGGGALNVFSNIDVIRRTGRLFYLRANLETLAERLRTTAESRPLLAGLSHERLEDRMVSLLKARESAYSQADDRIETDGRDAVSIAEDVIDRLRRNLQ
jgi:shikimate kinase